jgi:hypothetical protein
MGPKPFFNVNIISCIITVVLCGININGLPSGADRTMAACVYAFTVYAVAVLSIFIRDYERELLKDVCEEVKDPDYTSHYYRITLAGIGLAAAIVLFINYILAINATGHSLNSFFSESFLMITTSMMMYVLHNRFDSVMLAKY